MIAKELRIGNLLQDDKSKVILKVIEVKENGALFYVTDRSKFPLLHEWKAEQIPLTEEWLIKFGFEFDGYNEFTKGDLLFDNEYTDKGEWNVILKGVDIKPVESKNKYVCNYYPKAEIKYVHQLQNLYFALTNEELTIKE
jgi:hypothetical protein